MTRFPRWLAALLAVAVLSWLVAGQSRSGSIATPNLPAAGEQKTANAIEFGWPSDLAVDTCWLVIGSLEDAGTLTPVDLELVTFCRQPDAQSPAIASPGPVADGGLCARDLSRMTHHPLTLTLSPTGERGLDKQKTDVTSVVRLAAWTVPDRLLATFEIDSTTPATSRGFFIQTAPESQSLDSYQPVMTRLAAESERVRIWEEVGDGVSTPPAQIAWQIERLESDILPKLTNLYGEIADVDGDGKLSICLTDRLADFPTTDSPVEGLVQVHDFQTDLPRPHSNQADVLFLSRSLKPGPQALAVLAHEAAHLAVFSRRQDVDPHGFRSEDDWLNEGFAHFAEVHCSGSWSNLEARIAAFRSRPESSPLVVIDAQREGFWRDPGSRGAAWSFLTWLSDEHGPHIVAELAAHPDVGRKKIETVVNQPFEEVFRRWTVSGAANSQASNGAPERREITVCGTGHCVRRLDRPASKSSGWKITVPEDRRVQVTLVEPTTGRCWIMR